MNADSLSLSVPLYQRVRAALQLSSHRGGAQSLRTDPTASRVRSKSPPCLHLPLCLGRGRAGANVPLLALALGFRPRPRALVPGSSDPGVPPSLLSPVSLLVFRLRRLALGTRRAGDGSAPAGEGHGGSGLGLCSPSHQSIGGQGPEGPAAESARPAWRGCATGEGELSLQGRSSGVCRHKKLHRGPRMNGLGGSEQSSTLVGSITHLEDAQNHRPPEVQVLALPLTRCRTPGRVISLPGAELRIGQSRGMGSLDARDEARNSVLSWTREAWNHRERCLTSLDGLDCSGTQTWGAREPLPQAHCGSPTRGSCHFHFTGANGWNGGQSPGLGPQGSRCGRGGHPCQGNRTATHTGSYSREAEGGCGRGGSSPCPRHRTPL